MITTISSLATFVLLARWIDQNRKINLMMARYRMVRDRRYQQNDEVVKEVNSNKNDKVLYNNDSKVIYLSNYASKTDRENL
jgi:hypothetical protein